MKRYDDDFLVSYLKECSFNAGRTNMGCDDPVLSYAAARILELKSQVNQLTLSLRGAYSMNE